MGTSINAFGIYSYYIGKSGEFLKIGTEGYLGSSSFIFYQRENIL